MTPFYFGTQGRTLFGIYYPAAAKPVRSAGVVICPPLGVEYVQTYRAMRQVALHLTKAGYHVLRFDYFGTGDSSGEMTEAALPQWQQDVSMAMDELIDTAGVSECSLIGLRLGASLSLLTAAERNDIRDIILWDPVVNGRDYVDAMRRSSRPSVERKANLAAAPADAVQNLAGFHYTERLLGELAEVDLKSVVRCAVSEVNLTVSEEAERYGRLQQHLADSGIAVNYRHLAEAGEWYDMTHVQVSLLPSPVIRSLTQPLLESTAQ